MVPLLLLLVAGLLMAPVDCDPPEPFYCKTNADYEYEGCSAYHDWQTWNTKPFCVRDQPFLPRSCFPLVVRGSCLKGCLCPKNKCMQDSRS
jgi:hypothetical protein